MRDGCRLAARVWMPVDAAKKPVPAILEYLPYRKRDGTAERDELTHPYFAANGYACVRVDMSGNGDSDGLMLFLKKAGTPKLPAFSYNIHRRYIVDTEKIRDSSNGLSLKERKGWNE